MNQQLESLAKVWPDIKSVFSVPHSEEEYQALVATLDSLLDEVGEDATHELMPVMETVGRLIENYEEHTYPVEEASVVDTLKYLMQEHGLKQADLKEIGSQGIVSEILSGKRLLNIEQIKKLSQRFHVSPLVFI